jgi:hypothetical protein
MSLKITKNPENENDVGASSQSTSKVLNQIDSLENFVGMSLSMRQD